METIKTEESKQEEPKPEEPRPEPKPERERQAMPSPIENNNVKLGEKQYNSVQIAKKEPEKENQQLGKKQGWFSKLKNFSSNALSWIKDTGEVVELITMIKNNYQNILPLFQKIYSKTRNIGTNISSVPQQYRKFVEMSKQVYDSKRNKIEDYEYVKGGGDYGIWENDKEIILAIRGTIVTKLRDILSDVLIAGDKIKSSERYNKIKNIINDLMKQNKKIVLTGHSLGGTLAIELGKELSLPVVAFDAGQGISESYLNDNKYYSNIILFKKKSSLISLLAGLHIKNYVLPGSTHSISTF